MLKALPEILVILLEGLLASLQWKSELVSTFASDPLDAFFLLLAAQIFVIAAYITFRVHSIKRDLNDNVNMLRDTVTRFVGSRSTFETLFEQDFHGQFRMHLSSAQRIVSMAHLDFAAPNSRAGTASGDYFKDLTNLIRTRPGVTFQRLEVVGEEKEEWIQQLVKELDGTDNFSLRVLSVPCTDRALPHVSVQLIDDSITYLVAVSHHTRDDRARDIFIKDSTVNEIWRTYYDDVLWEGGIPILDRGVLNVKNYQKLIEGISHRDG